MRAGGGVSAGLDREIELTGLTVTGGTHGSQRFSLHCTTYL